MEAITGGSSLSDCRTTAASTQARSSAKVKQWLSRLPSSTRVSLTRELKMLLPQLPGGCVLDVGSAKRMYSNLIPGVQQYFGIDVQPHRALDAVADACSLPFAEKSFDSVLAIEVIEHILEPAAAIREMYRVTRPGGHVVITTRFLYQLHGNPADYWRFTRSSLAHLFRDFSLVQIKPLGNRASVIFDFVVRARNPVRCLSWMPLLLPASEIYCSGFLVNAIK